MAVDDLGFSPALVAVGCVCHSCVLGLTGFLDMGYKCEIPAESASCGITVLSAYGVTVWCLRGEGLETSVEREASKSGAVAEKLKRSQAMWGLRSVPIHQLTRTRGAAQERCVTAARIGCRSAANGGCGVCPRAKFETAISARSRVVRLDSGRGDKHSLWECTYADAVQDHGLKCVQS